MTMSGKPITQQQVKLYMSNRNQPDQSKAKSAAKAGLSERSARRIDSGEHKTHKPPWKYRTRKDPFERLFTEHVVPLLEQIQVFSPSPC